MNDLISRQAAIDLFPNDALEWDTKGGYVAPHIVRRMIEELPSADAVPVIRCKDCKWYYRGGATCMYWDGENGMRGDDYCSQAERKEE